MEENIVEDEGQEVAQEPTEQASEGQSETTDEGAEALPKTYQVLGKDMSSDELYEEYQKTQAYITKLQQERAAREAEVQEEAADAVSRNELLQDVDPNVAEAIKQIVTPVIQDALRQRDETAAKEARDRELRQAFDNAEKKYDGKDGYPKFNKTAVTNYMLDNEVYDPERAYLLMNQSSIIDAEVRKAMKGGRKSTESTAGSTPEKPEGKPPKSWDEASKRAAQR